MEVRNSSDLFSDTKPNDALPTTFNSDDFCSLVAFAGGVNRSQYGKGRQNVSVERGHHEDLSRLLVLPHLPR